MLGTKRFLYNPSLRIDRFSHLFSIYGNNKTSLVYYIGLTADMAQGLWPNQEGVSPDLNLPQQERVDRQMIRHLLGKYSREELGRLLQEEGRMSPSSCKNFFFY